MPEPTPFHPRTQELCTSLYWKQWAGCHAVRSYDTSHELEYHAIRHAAAVIDVSPLYKYEVVGEDAANFLSYATVRDITALKPGRAVYTCWCDDDGKVVDDGTISRLTDQHFRVTAAEPAYAWLSELAARFQVTITDTSRELAALAVQGPGSRALLDSVCDGAVQSLRFFGVREANIDRHAVQVSRTGYTGDLGYEVWVARDSAVDVWDAIMAAAPRFGARPAGLDALDVARVEAGFIMNGVDYFSANHCLIEERKSSPFEIGLGWTVQLERSTFVGQGALRAESQRQPRWALAGLEIDWRDYEMLFAAKGLPPQPPAGAWRDPVPVFHGRHQVGYATSGAWSPLLKKNLALTTLQAPYAKPNTRLEIEVTVEYERQRATALVTSTPFYNPRRKRRP